MTAVDMVKRLAGLWGEGGRVRLTPQESACEMEGTPELLPDVARRLVRDLGLAFAGLIVEEGAEQWDARYVFYGDRDEGLVHAVVHRPLSEPRLPTLTAHVPAADWHEREAEDMFGLAFDGHPRLGDFILHDDAWQEGVAPMRKAFDGRRPLEERRPNPEWRPRRIVEAAGAFTQPVGPVFAGLAESVHFQLETVGEDVIRSFPRLFYKYRGVEKIAEGRPALDGLLLAERFCATSAFAHGLAYCEALESISATHVPERARKLRVLVAELERVRHHVAAVEAICESTGLAVAASQVGLLEEELLRISGSLTGHRYLFGLLAPGGLAGDLEDTACRETVAAVRGILARLEQLSRMLRFSSSFLDRLEEVGLVTEEEARRDVLVGPVARASGVARDLRRVLPYAAYEPLDFDVPVEREGDGYARLRLLLAETAQSLRLMDQVSAALAAGPVLAPWEARPGAALGWAEAPRGAAFHWVRVTEDAALARYHVMPPSFANWQGFHLAAEDFAFQDFPIILATFDLSVAESDR